MNSGLKRVCASRGRLIHRSKNIERHILVLPSGAELFLGLRASTQKINGRNDGNTFNAGIHAMKRTGAAVSRDFKRLMWHGL